MYHPLMCMVTLLVATATAQPQQSAIVAPATPRDTVETLAQLWMDAAQRQDRPLLEQLMAPDFILVRATEDSAESRAHWLEGTVRHPSKALVFERTRVVRYGDDMAIVTGILRVDVGQGQGRIAVTDVWRKRGGRWQVATRFAARPQDLRQATSSERPIR